MSDSKKKITVSGVISLLDQGKHRNEIKKELNLSDHDMKVLFGHPSLKGLKPRKVKETSFELIDDISGDVNEVVLEEELSEDTGLEEQPILEEETKEVSEFGFEH